MHRRLITYCVAALGICVQPQQPLGSSCVPQVHSLAGSAKPFETRHEISVLLFVATDCPISNRYAPVIRQLAAAAPSDRVAFWLIYADPETTQATMQRHREEFDLPIASVLDRDHRFVKLAGATTVPEAAVFVRRGEQQRLAYRGRIDDRFPTLGVVRAEPAHHDLKCVLSLLLNGKATAFSSQAAVGCPIPDLVQIQ